mmetsp:Transcript_19428/g.33419  ORF Transcript_19428/g.33419 Transcript_19428/m.33419 type:complete len:285 (+) Transcript_19428:41-895(+)
MSDIFKFNAGRLRFDNDNKKLLVADITPGEILVGEGEDGLVHFRWINRGTGDIEEDFIVFPGDAVFHKLKQTEDRVYSLKFQSTGKRTFYWMQNKSTDNDAKACQTVNEKIESNVDDTMQEDTQPSSTSNQNQTNADVNVSNGNEQSNASSTANNVASQMQDVLSGLFAGGALEQSKDIDLIDILSSSAVGPLLTQDDDQLRANVLALTEHLPGETTRVDEIVDLLRSPQFKQAVNQLDQALSSGGEQLAGILTQLGLEPSFAAQFPPVEAFIRALIAKHASSS